jgi:hypothetical protein
MKPSLSLPLSADASPATPRRWWLGWFQLLCAWLLCMLLCANVALVLAADQPSHEPERPVARKPADCTPAGGAADTPIAPPTLREALRCSGA